MTVTRSTYATRGQVKRAADIVSTALRDPQVDRALQSGAELVDQICRRRFTPTVATRSFRYPDHGRQGRAWRLWLGPDELISLTSLTSGGTTVDTADVFLEPANIGPPYHSIEVDRSTTATWSAGNTSQRAVQVTGLFGYTNTETPGGTLAAAVASTTATTVTVSDSSLIDVGSLIRVGTERMLVTGRAMATTTAFLFGAGETASTADTLVIIDTGSKVTAGEVITIGAERMLVTGVSGNNLTVRRGWDGTTVAAHANLAVVYAPRLLTVERGAYGTTPATHDSGAAVAVWQPPGLVRDLTVAYALTQLAQELAGYARVVGAGEGQREAAGKGLAALEQECRRAHGRQILAGTV